MATDTLEPPRRWAGGLALPQWRRLGGLLALVALVLLRTPLEAGMLRHMLVQQPALLLTGALCLDWLRTDAQARLQRWNALGLAGLTLCGITVALLMVPRLLDLCVADGRVDAMKYLALLLSGAALRLSWGPAGAVVQLFFLGNMLAMMAVAGMTYLNAEIRVCNAYRLDEQADAGRWLVGLALLIAAGWLMQIGRKLKTTPREN